jgi:hypothetical protein
VVYSVPINEAITTESQRYNCFIRNGGNATPSTPVQRLKVAIQPLDSPCSGSVTHSGDISTTGKSHKRKPDGSSKDDMEIPLKRLLDM